METRFACCDPDEFILKILQGYSFQPLYNTAEEILFSICPLQSHRCLIDIQDFDQDHTFTHHVGVCGKVLLKIRDPILPQGIQPLFDGGEILFPQGNG